MMATGGTRVHQLHYFPRDPVDVATYNVTEAARYLRIPPATLRSWVKGQRYKTSHGEERFHPVIRLAVPEQNLLSFNNVVEAHILRSLRTRHTVSLQNVRKALTYASDEMRIERPLLSGKLRTTAGDLFLDYYYELVNLSKSGQLAVRRFFREHLERVQFKDELPVRLYPFVITGPERESRNVVIDPHVSFGRPMIADVGVTTGVVARRYNAGESLSDLVDDYGLTEEQVEDAVLFEAA